MRRALPIVAVLAVIVVVVVIIAARGSGSHPYEVRAIFDNADFVIPGEDVKVAGVKVGRIADLDVTPDDKAAVVLEIDQAGYQDFRKDASCIVRPQSLIGERFVECTPTQPRAVGAKAPPPLRKIQRGAGKGQYLLPVSNTQQTVDIDLIGDIMRQPEQQRLSLILNELGTGLAGRGKDLNEVIRRADPALQETDKVLKILADQNTTLEELATNSDTVLAPLARDRASVGSAIKHSSDVAEATAERQKDLAADIQTLPEFLDQLKPTMTQLGQLADESTPVLADLHAVAPQVNGVIENLGPFSQAAIPAFTSLGTAAEHGIPAVTAAQPVIADLRDLATTIRPVGSTAAALLTSLKQTKGIERLMDYIFFQAAAINGFDSLGHYLRAELIVNQCSTYAIQPVAGCSSNFPVKSGATTKAVANVTSAVGDDPILKATAEALAKALDDEVAKVKKAHGKSKRRAPGTTTKPQAKKKQARAHATPAPATTPAATPTPGSGVTTSPSGPVPTPTAPPAPAATDTPTPTPTPTATPNGTGDSLLDYLFGGGNG